MLLRVATINIQNGVRVTKGYRQYALLGWRYYLPHAPRALEGVVDLADRESIDVLTLQEAEGGSFRSRYIDYVQWLASRTELERARFFPTYSRTWRGRVMSNQGNAVLSRFPLEAHENHRLPGPGEPRYLSEAAIRCPGGTVAVFTTHLSLAREVRAEQLAAIARIVGDRSGPKVLTGDLNTPNPEELRVLEASGLCKLPTGPSYPSWAPRRSLDHIFTGPECRGAATVIERVEVADHLPVVATIEVEGAA